MCVISSLEGQTLEKLTVEKTERGTREKDSKKLTKADFHTGRFNISYRYTVYMYTFTLLRMVERVNILPLTQFCLKDATNLLSFCFCVVGAFFMTKFNMTHQDIGITSSPH